MKHRLLASVAACSLAGMFAANGAVILTAAGYTQDFDTLASTPDGGSYNKTTGSNPLPNGWDFLGDNNYTVDDGDRTNTNYYSYGNPGSPDRALGERGQGGRTAGVEFENQTGAAITELYVVYWGEQWQRSVGAPADQWFFQYSTTAGALNAAAGNWTTHSPLTLSSPNLSVVAGNVAVDGNAAGNRTLLSDKITGLNIPVGATFWIRWDGYSKPSGQQDALAIDDLYVGIKPIPEPGTITGLGVIALLSCLRRRR